MQNPSENARPHFLGWLHNTCGGAGIGDWRTLVPPELKLSVLFWKDFSGEWVALVPVVFIVHNCFFSEYIYMNAIYTVSHKSEYAPDIFVNILLCFFYVAILGR